MTAWLNLLLNSNGYIPHGHCYLWKPGLVWLHTASDAAIALAYYSIPLFLVYFVSKRRDVPFNWMFLLFGAFIILCGTGHLLEIWTLWHPVYWFTGLLKAVTAIVSVYTALELIPLIPKVLALPSPAELEAANRELEQTLQQLKQMQAQLVQTEKMSSLGQLVAGVAHEINNPVNFIYGNLTHASNYAQDILHLLKLYQCTYPDPTPTIQETIEAREIDFLQEDLPKTLASMKLGAERIQQIVLSLRNFSRLDESEMKTVNIHDGIDSTLLILQHRCKSTSTHKPIEIRKQYGKIPLMACYAGQLNQVFMNILSNAIDALEEAEAKAKNPEWNAAITIQTEPGYLQNSPNLPCVVIRITDNALGMSETVHQRLFNPFFTTKPVGKGTGLGLSISYQVVVEKHQGQLECISTPGQGTTFVITIPISPKVKKSTPVYSVPSCGFSL